MIPIAHVIALSFILFVIGLAGLFTRRDALSIFLSVEILLNAANVAFVGFAHSWGNEAGHVAVFIVVAVAAAEAAIGLSIAIGLSHKYESLTLKDITELKG